MIHLLDLFSRNSLCSTLLLSPLSERIIALKSLTNRQVFRITMEDSDSVNVEDQWDEYQLVVTWKNPKDGSALSTNVW